MRLLTVPSLLALALLSAVVSVPLAPELRDDSRAYWLEVENAVPVSAGVLFFDDGQGVIPDDSVVGTVDAALDERLMRFPLQPGRYRRFVALWPSTDASLEVEAVRLLDRNLKTLRRFEGREFWRPESADDWLPLVDDDAGFRERLAAGRLLVVEPDDELSLQISFGTITRQVLARIPWLFAPALLLLLLLGRSKSLPARIAGVRQFMARRPVLALMVVAAMATAANMYPTIFLGRSLASPGFLSGSLRLYDQHPTLPGAEYTELDDVKGADVTAFGWQHGPYASVQHRSLLHDGDWPLWNRYNSAGTVLLAQGQSMFGDPLQFLVIAANGAAGAWDLKFVLARWLFALGVALAVWQGTRHLPSAVVSALSAPFIGFFVVRVNHPAVFSLCYAPWIIVAWLGYMQSSTRRRFVLWLGALVGSNWMVLCSGTAKEAFALIVMLNLTGLLALMLTSQSGHWKAVRIAAAAGAGVVLVLMSAPFWWTFLDVLPRAHTMYEARMVYQISPTLLLGLFDEIFYRPLVEQQRVWNPSANFLTLGGVLAAVVSWRTTMAQPFKRAVAISAGVAMLVVYGVVPPEWIARLPLVGNIGHIDNTFSCVLIVLLLVFAGFGYHAVAVRFGSAGGRTELFLAVVLLLGLCVFPWISYTQAVHRPTYGEGTVASHLRWGESLPVHEFVWASLFGLTASLIGLGVVVCRSLRAGQWTVARVLLAVTAALVLLWRHGQHAPGVLDMYVVNPPARVSLLAPSPALEFVRRNSEHPTRVAGIGNSLVPGWSAVYGLEGLSGCDALSNRKLRELMIAMGFRYENDWQLVVPGEDLPRLRPGGDVLNVAHYVGRPGTFSFPPEILPVIHTSDLEIMHSGTCWPRAFFVDRVGTYQSLDEWVPEALTARGRPLAMMQRSELPAHVTSSSSLEKRTIAAAENYRLTGNETSFEVETSGSGMIVLHEAWLEGDFVATLDGAQVPYHRVNHAFKGVWVETAGRHRVSFRYRPAVWTRSLLLSAIGGAVVLGALAALLRPHIGIFRR